ncbi:MAG: hypothetical protein HY550_07650 [Elusimicrobia bacterium]|nr:hypothetical protein [Elusimicrobiota bacterium]
MKTALLTLCFLLCCAASARAENLPNLRNQAAWSEKDKKEFLGFLKSNQPIPAGQVKQLASGNGGGLKAPSKARYASLALVSDTMILDIGGGRSRTETATLGPKLLVGGHVFSWVRYYAGLKYNRIGQEKLDGTRAHLSHAEIPVGLELALIPLGTPHTRYFLLRGGVSEHYFYGGAEKSEFREPLPGWRPAWNLGLGYEWQFDNSNWRFHSLAEGYRSFSGGAQFYGIGLTAGFVYTF